MVVHLLPSLLPSVLHQFAISPLFLQYHTRRYPSQSCPPLHQSPDLLLQTVLPLVERSLEDGGTVWEYRYTGMSSPMLIPITEAWCIEYTLLFDLALLVEKGLWSIAGSKLRLGQ